MNSFTSYTLSFIDLFTAIYCGFCFLELNSSNYKFICLILIVVWIVIASFSDYQALGKVFQNEIIRLLFVYAFIYFLYVSYTRGIVYGLKYSLTIIINESPLLLFIFYKNSNNKSDLSRLLPWFGFIVILYLCTNILKLIAVDPNAARKLAADTNIYQNYITGGGYQIAYALSLLVPFLIFSFNKYKNKIITIFFILVFSYTFIKCSYTIAILIGAFELFLLYYWKKEITSSNKTTAILCFLFFAVLLFFLREPIGNLFINHVSPLFSGSFAERRMREFGEFIKGESKDKNGAAYRMSLYIISIKTFLQHPLVGISYRTRFMENLEANYLGTRYVGIHSTIFDGFARIGISFVLYIIYYWKAIKYLKNNTGRSSIAIIGTTFFMIKLVNVANAFVLGYIVYFAIPLLFEPEQETTYTLIN